MVSEVRERVLKAAGGRATGCDVCPAALSGISQVAHLLRSSVFIRPEGLERLYELIRVSVGGLLGRTLSDA